MKVKVKEACLPIVSLIGQPWLTVWPDGYISYSIFGHLQQWTFAPITKMAKVGLQILPNMKETLQKLPTILKCSPKWRIFAKSGHTADWPHWMLTKARCIDQEKVCQILCC